MAATGSSFVTRSPTGWKPPCRSERSGATARVVMGDLWGVSAPTTQYAATIYADIILESNGAIPIDAGADEYVMKPFDRETLESKLQIVGAA